MKDNVIGLVSKNIPRHVFNKRKNKYGLWISYQICF
jgi:hypothetical protein